MPTPNPDDLLLLIRCPSCAQRFKVGDDLRDRTVECGGCEHRFRITDDVIVRGRKTYPGERGTGLNRFQRVPLPGGEAMIGMQPMRYSSMPDPAVLEPASPQRIIAGAVGVAGILCMALLLMFGASRGGLLDGMVLSKRLMMAGFASLLGIVLLVYANPKARLKALAVGILLSAGVIAVPFGFRTGSVPLRNHGDAGNPGEDSGEAAPARGSSGKGDIAALRALIGTGPLVAEINRLDEEKSGKRAIGLWLRGMNGRNRFLVMDYILRATGADPATHYYPRDNGDFLLVVTGITSTLQELAKTASTLGEIENIYPDISVVEVSVRNESFLEGPIEKLGNNQDPAFYDLNKRELESIDLDRVKRAVQRIAEAEPKIYRVDITRKLIELLGVDAVDFKGNICTALSAWSEHPGPAGDAALAVVLKLVAANEPVPHEIIDLIVKERNAGVIPILDELWFRNPMDWEMQYGDMGAATEPFIVRRFPTTKGTIRYSAVRLMGRVGGADSMQILAGVAAGSDPELSVLLEKARNSIQARIGR